MIDLPGTHLFSLIYVKRPKKYFEKEKLSFFDDFPGAKESWQSFYFWALCLFYSSLRFELLEELCKQLCCSGVYYVD
jgi:hypothetical protein